MQKKVPIALQLFSVRGEVAEIYPQHSSLSLRLGTWEQNHGGIRVTCRNGWAGKPKLTRVI